MGAVSKIYILHGWTYSTDKWQELLSLLAKAGVEAQILKVPGLTAASDQVWNLDMYVDWLNEATKNHRGPFVLAGHSNGGRIGLAFAARYPGRLQHLVLIDSAGVYHDEPLLRLKRSVFGAAAKAGKKLSSSPQLRRVLYRLARAHDYEQASPQMRQTMVNLTQADRQLDLAQVSTPTTIIWGDADKVTPLSDGRLMATQIPRADLKIVHGGRHSPFYTHPQAVARYILEALQ